MASLLSGETYGMPNVMQVGGLLSNPALQIGLGILANNNSKNFGQVLGRGALQGIGNLQQMQAFQTQQALLNSQLQRQRQAEEQSRRQQELLGQVAQDYNLDPNVLSAYPQIGEDVIKNKLLPKQKKIGFTPSGVAYDENNPDLALGQNYAKPDAPSTPANIQEYNFAKDQGYKGSFLDFQLAQKRAGAPSTKVEVGFPKEQFKNERDLRNDFQGLPTTKAFREVQTSYDQITTALKNPSAANDLAAATKFMKLLDPGSVVRESELGMAMAATGQVDRMSNYLNMLQTGQKLTPSQRQDFAKSAQQLYGAAANRYNEAASEYQSMAQDYELNPNRIAKPVEVPKPETPKTVVKRGKYNGRTVVKYSDGTTAYAD